MVKGLGKSTDEIRRKPAILSAMPSRLFGIGGREADRRQDRRRVPSVRALSIAAALIFAALMGVALVLAIRTEHHVEGNRAAGNAARGFGEMSGAIQAQEIVLQEYASQPGADQRERFDAQTEFVQSRLTRLGERRDSEDVKRLAPLYDRFTSAAHGYFDAVDSGNLRAARRLDTGTLDPLSMTLTETASGITQRNANQADDSNSTLEDVSESMLLVLPIAFLIAGAALYLLGRAGRRSQRAEDEARAELRVLEHAALTDSLTGLRNYRAFEADLAKMIAEAGRTNSPLTLVSFDVDGLKAVNDSLGHQVGDRRLREVAACLLSAMTASDRAYRVGGDEFAMLLPGCGAWTAYGAAERVRAVLCDGGSDVDVAAGVAEAKPLEGQFDLVRHADLALINAKRTNRQVIIYSPDLDGVFDGQPRPADHHQQEILSTALARAVDAKDAYTRRHSEIVSNLCVLMGTELGLDTERIAQLRIAGMLHDVGKIGTPDAILNKPASLTAGERETIEKHPVLGAGILDAAELGPESSWIRHHHERPDGSGYPDGLLGDEVPIESRIIGVADAFVAMTSDRPYRSARSELEALDELERFAGAQFDPECVEALRRALRVTPPPVQVEVSVSSGHLPAAPRARSRG
jgi:diguanylate cyclase (GGDEF)-like protein